MLINWLIERAKRTPYFHLPGYMNRWWLVPYNQVIWRGPSEHHGDIRYCATDGTGPVTWRRPVVRLLQKLGVAIRVHEILRSDSGRDPHDHPWPYLTVILKGGYFEERYDDQGKLVSTKYHGAGSVLWRPAGSWHRLIVPNGQTVTTLFVSGKKACTWGFNVDGKKVPYHEYKEGA
jgi:hypothetical protein